MNTKFMLALDNRVYVELKKSADDRGINIQELLRAIVVPYWMKRDNGPDEGPFLRQRTRPPHVLASPK